MMSDQNWDVLIIGGPSGVGKSSVSYPLARHFDVPIVEVDDLFHAVEALTTPEQQPMIHYWQTHPEAAEFPAERILELFLEVSHSLSPAIEAVINNHIETRAPVILDGDYILPEMAARYSERVKAIFLYEEDHSQITSNFLKREPNAGEQRGRAEVSQLFGRWLQDECRRFGLKSLPSQPWETVLERTVTAISE